MSSSACPTPSRSRCTNFLNFGIEGRPLAFPPQGGRWPEGPDEGEEVRRITPVGTLISLASLDSFPLEGGSLFAWGATTRRAYLRACRGRQAPRNNAPCRAGACPLRPISPSVICFANATSLVRGRLFAGVFSLTPSDEGRLPLSGEMSRSDRGDREIAKGQRGVGMLSSAARLGERSPRFPRRARSPGRDVRLARDESSRATGTDSA